MDVLEFAIKWITIVVAIVVCVLLFAGFVVAVYWGLGWLLSQFLLQLGYTVGPWYCAGFLFVALRLIGKSPIGLVISGFNDRDKR